MFSEYTFICNYSNFYLYFTTHCTLALSSSAENWTCSQMLSLCAIATSIITGTSLCVSNTTSFCSYSTLSLPAAVYVLPLDALETV